MILLAVGTERFSFGRLVRAIDDAAPTFDDEVFGQIGTSDHVPVNFPSERLVPFERLRELVEGAGRVVCHAGAGTTLLAVAAGHVPVVVPRLARFREHVDDHQLPFAHQLAERGLVLCAQDVHEACELVRSAPVRGALRRSRPDTELADWLFDFVRRSGA